MTLPTVPIARLREFGIGCTPDDPAPTVTDGSRCLVERTFHACGCEITHCIYALVIFAGPRPIVMSMFSDRYSAHRQSCARSSS